MTVICWDGKYLAVDSRRTRKRTAEVFDDSHKIDTDFRGVKVRGSYIRAVAQAGNTKTTRFMKAILRQDDDFINFLRKRWEEEKAGDLTTTRITEFKKGTLLIITRRSAWHFQISPEDGILFSRIEEGEKFSGGSGGKIGKFLMDVFDLSAQMAVSATTLHMHCCGGPVRYLKCRGLLSNVRPRIQTVEFADMSDLKREVMVRMRKMCSSKVRSLAEAEA